jgi:hypothetical protein
MSVNTGRPHHNRCSCARVSRATPDLCLAVPSILPYEGDSRCLAAQALRAADDHPAFPAAAGGVSSVNLSFEIEARG